MATQSFSIIKRNNIVQIHFECATSLQSANIADAINHNTPIEVKSFLFNKETQSVVVFGSIEEAEIEQEILSKIVERAFSKVTV